jgi:uncharacterized protein YodC (DUF2158 family)
MEFKPGDVVQLKSGGPRMTIQTLNGDSATCVWFEKNKENRSVFATVLLTASGGGAIRVASI